MARSTSGCTSTGLIRLDAGVDFIFTAGYSDTLHEHLLDPFPERVISVYPSLLPAFAEDEEAIGPALALGVRYIGVTFHFRTPHSGAGGSIIAQEPIPVDLENTVDTVAPRIAEVERWLVRFQPRPSPIGWIFVVHPPLDLPNPSRRAAPPASSFFYGHRRRAGAPAPRWSRPWAFPPIR